MDKTQTEQNPHFSGRRSMERGKKQVEQNSCQKGVTTCGGGGGEPTKIVPVAGLRG